MNRFLDEFKSTNCKLDIPTAVIIPNITMNTPPTMGSGIVANRAPNFPRMARRIIMIAPYCTTRRLPTCGNIVWIQLETTRIVSSDLYRYPKNYMDMYGYMFWWVFLVFHREGAYLNPVKVFELSNDANHNFIPWYWIRLSDNKRGHRGRHQHRTE